MRMGAPPLVRLIWGRVEAITGGPSAAAAGAADRRAATDPATMAAARLTLTLARSLVRARISAPPLSDAQPLIDADVVPLGPPPSRSAGTGRRRRPCGRRRPPCVRAT